MVDSFLLTWNPTKFYWEDFVDEQLAVELGYDINFQWSCGVRKTLPRGSHVYMMRIGYRQPAHGIFLSGIVTSEQPYSDVHWDDSAKLSHTQYVDFDVTAMLNPNIHHLYQPYRLSSNFDWHPQSSGVLIPDDIAQKLDAEWREHLKNMSLAPREFTITPNQNGLKHFREGKKTTVTVNRYERDPKARQACIDHFREQDGTIKCQICGFDFVEFYGEIGQGFIEVHHLEPLAKKRQEYIVNPIRELLPVCANCHAMLHREIPQLTPEKLKLIIANNR